jgi:hypothetical protein
VHEHEQQGDGVSVQSSEVTEFAERMGACDADGNFEGLSRAKAWARNVSIPVGYWDEMIAVLVCSLAVCLCWA